MVPSSLLFWNKSCTFPDLVDPPIALSPIGVSLETARFPFKDSDAHATIPHSASTTHLRSDPHEGHGDMQLEGYIPGIPESAHPGSTVVPPFPTATNVGDSRGADGKDGDLGRPARQTGGAGRRELVSQALIFVLAFVRADLLLR
jgi:hypothetical protein